MAPALANQVAAAVHQRFQCQQNAFARISHQRLIVGGNERDLIFGADFGATGRCYLKRLLCRFRLNLGQNRRRHSILPADATQPSDLLIRPIFTNGFATQGHCGGRKRR